MQLVKVTPPAAAPTIVEPAPAVQGQDEQMNGNESGNDGGSADVQEGGSFYDADGGNEDTRVGEPQDDVKMEDAADGVMTVTVEETHTSTRLVYETRTMTP